MVVHIITAVWSDVYLSVVPRHATGSLNTRESGSIKDENISRRITLNHCTRYRRTHVDRSKASAVGEDFTVNGYLNPFQVFGTSSGVGRTVKFITQLRLVEK